MAYRYRNQITTGGDIEIGNALTQFNMARDTLGASFAGKCHVKVAGWGTDMEEISQRMQAMRTAARQ